MSTNVALNTLLLCVLSCFILSCFAGTPTSHHPQTFLEQVKGVPDEGAQIRDHFCVNCHGEKPLISLGAPRIKQMSDWDPRIKAGIELLLKHTKEGFNAMPPRGGCFECSDEQLTLAIAAMFSEEASTIFLEGLSK